MSDLEIPSWLQRLPLAPEFHPTETEFADPIAYISKIEKEACSFGICKVVPPLPKPSKKYVLSNINMSLLKCPDFRSNSDTCSISIPSQIGSGDKGNDGMIRAVFTTRHQELGHSSKRPRGPMLARQPDVYKQVWQSGEFYTLDQFESKSKAFARSLMSSMKEVSPLTVEAQFWKAASDKPIYIEYANDLPGSGFGEPEEPSQYFLKQKRKRKSNGESVTNEKDKLENVEESQESQAKTEEVSSSKTFCIVDREGTSGWKLSNSPWNLQVIARSAGSLTRFMPDEVPGVTSPMVYIGMLFSWFAWHVEDHELHSLNFLHMGSPKTWYGVPGDFAFALEEVIRLHGYGGNLDRLAALTLLGEKTTLMSPEIIVASGIPCCRLVQNPGEFVVTFPRAYHVGFSHGFNCGEAANFATPKWLKVAKEAAVRRAAMDYLPMLSHQQLLYLLSVSFVSRIPKALLPGIRSSRLSDRKKEEKENIVKKAFLDDIVRENCLLNIFLEKKVVECAVLWDPEMLPSASNGSSGLLVDKKEKIDGQLTPVNTENYGVVDGVNCPSSHLEQLKNVYYNEDDLPCGLHMDSGALACVACGLLGFPLMSVVQPSEEALEDMLSREGEVSREQMKSNIYSNETLKAADSGAAREDRTDNSYQKAEMTILTIDKNMVLTNTNECQNLTVGDVDFHNLNGIDICSHSFAGLEACLRGTEGCLKPLRHNRFKKVRKPWNTSSRILRPRIFCLEHALEIEKLLDSKGGANILIICHSDFPKIKEQALFIAEEVGVHLQFLDGALNLASKEDINLINTAIDVDEHEECGEDWTSKLGLNLKYCVKLRKLSPSKYEQHRLALGGLFSEQMPSLNMPSLKWISRKSRTHNKVRNPSNLNSCGRKSDLVAKNLGNEAKHLESSIGKPSPEVLGSKPRSRGRPRKRLPGEEGCGDITASGDGESLTSNVNEKADTGSVILALPTVAVSNSGISEKSESEDQPFTHIIDGVGETGKSVHSSYPKILDEVKAEGSDTLNMDGDYPLSSEADKDNQLSTVGPQSSSTVVPSAELSGTSFEILGAEETTSSNEVCYSEKPSLPSFSPGVSQSESGHLHSEGKKEGLEVCGSAQFLDTSHPGSSSDASVSYQNSQVPVEIYHEVCKFEKLAAGFPPVTSMESCEQVKADVADEVDLPASANSVRMPFIASLTAEVSEKQASQILCEPRRVEEAQNSRNLEGQLAVTGTSGLKMQQGLLAGQERNIASMIHSQGVPVTAAPIFLVYSKKRKRESGKKSKDPVNCYDSPLSKKVDCNSFTRGPCEGLRPRTGTTVASNIQSCTTMDKKVQKKSQKQIGVAASRVKSKASEESYQCDIEGCHMSFLTKVELNLHKCNRCTHKGCGKRFSSHKYAVHHQKVHTDERPLKCPWKECNMSFKWSWARTEHIRVHTGERPYQCKFEGCSLTFRFVSDFSRHRRKTGHSY